MALLDIGLFNSRMRKISRSSESCVKGNFMHGLMRVSW